MVDPIDYGKFFNRGRDVLGTFQGAAEVGAGIENLKLARLKREDFETQQAQAQKRQEQMTKDFRDIFDNPDPSRIARTMAMYPELQEQITAGYNLISEDFKREKLEAAGQIDVALNSDKPEVAADLAERQAQIYEQAGREKDAKEMRDLVKMIGLDPKMASGMVGTFLASVDPEKYVENAVRLQAERRAQNLEGAELTRAQAEAKEAAIRSDFAESKAAQELAKDFWDIQALQNDIAIKKENSRIALINTDIEREKNDIKREELQAKKEEMEAKRDEMLREKAAEVATIRADLDNFTSTIDDLLLTPVETLEDSLGAFDGSYIGKWIDSFDQDVQDFYATLESVRNQAFVAQIPKLKGSGSISNTEGEKFENAIQSLKEKQSPSQFLEKLREIQRLTQKTRDNLTTKYGVPDNLPDRRRLDEIEEKNRREAGYVEPASIDYIPAESGGPVISEFKVIGVRDAQ